MSLNSMMLELFTLKLKNFYRLRIIVRLGTFALFYFLTQLVLDGHVISEQGHSTKESESIYQKLAGLVK